MSGAAAGGPSQPIFHMTDVLDHDLLLIFGDVEEDREEMLVLVENALDMVHRLGAGTHVGERDGTPEVCGIHFQCLDSVEQCLFRLGRADSGRRVSHAPCS